MRCKFAYIACAVSILVSGCAMEQDDGETEFISVSELKSNVDEALKGDYGQIVLSDGIICDIPDEIYVPDLYSPKEFNKRYKEVFSILLDGIEWNDNEIEKVVPNEKYPENYFIMIDNDADKYYAVTGNDGFIAGLRSFGFDVSFSEIYKAIGTYHVNRKCRMDDVYSLCDGDISIADATGYVNEWMNTKYASFENNAYEYKVKYVSVREFEDKHFFKIRVERYYKGLSLGSFNEVINISGEEESKIEAKYLSKYVEVCMFNKDEIGSLTNGGTMLIPNGDKKVTEIISLESALNACEKYFADYGVINISEISLKISIMPGVASGNPKTGLIWEFLIDVDPEEVFTKDVKLENYNDYLYKRIYVNALTGEIDFDFNLQINGLED